MGRRQSGAEARSRRTGEGLEEPFPCAPRYPSKHGIYIYLSDGRLHFYNFAATYAARHCLDLIIGGREFKWRKWEVCPSITYTTIEFDGIRIRGEQPQDLEDIMEYEMSSAEASWEVPPNLGPVWERLGSNLPPRSAVPVPSSYEPPAAPAAPRVTKERTPRAAKPEGVVTVGEIAAQMNMDAKHARDALRRSKLEKPAHGWAWPANEVEAIKRIIKENAK